MKIVELLKKIEARIEEDIAKTLLPGANYGLFYNGFYYYGSLGYKAVLPEKIRISDNINYDMASLSKVISTTSCILKLIEEKKISLKTKVSEIIPEFRFKEIIIFDLLTHSSGLKADIPKSFELKDKEEVRKKILESDLLYPTGEKIVYSDLGFILLGWIVENVSKQTLDDFAAEKIFIPLEMYHTYYNPINKENCAPTEFREDNVYNGVLQGLVHDEKAFALGGVAGHAGLFSTTRDVMNYVTMVFNKGVFNGKRIFEKETIENLFFRHKEFINNGKAEYRSLGWDLRPSGSCAGDLVSQNTIMHTGFTGTNIFIDLEKNLSFVLLTNAVHPKRGRSEMIKLRNDLGNMIVKILEA